MTNKPIEHPLSEPVIEAIELSKRYGEVTAVDRVSFSVQRGEIVGFLGTNGAGKTTALRMLAGYFPPTSGTARIAGHDILQSPRSARRQIGYLPERPPLYLEMTVRGYLLFIARIKGLRRRLAAQEVDRVMSEVDVVDVADRLIAPLSRGFQQRVAIAQALIGQPPVLLLDEPTMGLDPNQMQFVRALVRRLGRERTVLFSTHLLHEVEEVCSRALVILEGRIVADAAIAELADRVSGGLRLAVGLDGATDAQIDRARRVLYDIVGIDHVEPDPGKPTRLIVMCNGAGPPRAEIARKLVEEQLPLGELTLLRPRLEEVFRQLTHGGLEPPGGVVPVARAKEGERPSGRDSGARAAAAGGDTDGTAGPLDSEEPHGR